MRAFIKFNKGLLKLPLPSRLWVMLLVVFNMVIPLFYLGRLEAKVVLLVILASMTLMTILTALTGFSRLLGLAHILWFPLIYFLWTRLDNLPTESFYGLWIRALIVLNAVSLIMDVADVIRYVAGDRRETIQGL